MFTFAPFFAQTSFNESWTFVLTGFQWLDQLSKQWELLLEPVQGPAHQLANRPVQGALSRPAYNQTKSGSLLTEPPVSLVCTNPRLYCACAQGLPHRTLRRYQESPCWATSSKTMWAQRWNWLFYCWNKYQCSCYFVLLFSLSVDTYADYVGVTINNFLLCEAKVKLSIYMVKNKLHFRKNSVFFYPSSLCFNPTQIALVYNGNSVSKKLKNELGQWVFFNTTKYSIKILLNIKTCSFWP